MGINSRNEKRQRNRRMYAVGRKYGKKQSGHEKRSPDGLSLPNQNAILMNIIWYYCIRYGKIEMKFN